MTPIKSSISLTSIASRRSHGDRRLLSGLCGHGALLATVLAFIAYPASAQDGAQPRPIPEGFVLPGPAPTNAPNINPDGTLPDDDGAVAEQSTGSAAPTTGEDSPAPAAAASRPTSVGGQVVGSQETVVGPGVSSANPMAFASRPEDGTTNWPCMQRKVDSIQPAQVWSGPPLEIGAQVRRDSEMRRLVEQVVVRRVELDEARAMVDGYLESIPDERKEAVAAALFSDILNRLNSEREQVMAGIERYGAKQKALAAALREKSRAMSELQRAGADIQALNEARDSMVWDTRIFDERRQSLTYVCEVPTLIEQRAFALGRELSSKL